MLEPAADTAYTLTHLPETVEGLSRAFQEDPEKAAEALFKGLINYDTWKSDPAAAAGQFGVGILLTLVGAGALSGVSAASKAGRSARGIDAAAASARVVEATSGTKGNWSDLLNGRFEPLTTYVVDKKFTYVTDDAGRVVQAHAVLDRTGISDRNNYQQRVAGGADRLPGDDGGHIYASRFLAPGDGINITAMRNTLNRVGDHEYSRLEQTWADAINEVPPRAVDVNVRINYNSDSLRPSSYEIVHQISGGPRIRTRLDNGL